MNDYLKRLCRFTKINSSLILSYIIVTTVIISMSYSYVQNNKINKISRGFLSKDSIELRVQNSYEGDLGSIINKNLSSNSAVIKKEFLSNGFVAEINRIYFKSEFEVPSLLEGRFLKEDESFSDKRVAVVGQGLIEHIVQKNEKEIIMINNFEYEVIGICGEEYKSRLDSMIYIPMTSNEDYKFNDIINIDNLNDIDNFIQVVKEESENKIILEKVQEGMLIQGTIDPLTGEVKEAVITESDLDSNTVSFYIYTITFISVVLCIISISIYWYDRNKKEVFVCKLLGFYEKEIFIRLMKKYCKIAILGSTIGIVVANIFFYIL